MAENLQQAEGALKKGVSFIETARPEVKQLCNNLGVQMSTTTDSHLKGQGGKALNNLMMAWQDKQEKILQALDELKTNIQDTDRQSLARDLESGQGFTSDLSRLDGI